jgi:hypothetical protein
VDGFVRVGPDLDDASEPVVVPTFTLDGAVRGLVPDLARDPSKLGFELLDLALRCRVGGLPVVFLLITLTEHVRRAIGAFRYFLSGEGDPKAS